MATTIAALLWPLLAIGAQPTDYVSEAQAYLDKGEYRAAVIQLKNALQADPGRAQARLLLGTTYLTLGDGLSAQKELSRAREMGVPRNLVLAPLGRAYLLSGHGEELLQTIDVDDSDPATLKIDILVLRGEAYLFLKQYPAAAEKFDEALALQPESASALLGKAKIAAQHDKNPAQAMEFVDRAVFTAPDNADVWTFKGVLLREAGNQAEALSAFDRALSGDPANVAARLGKAAALIALSLEGEALAELDRVQKRYSQNYLVHYLRALALFRQGQLAPAQESIELALQQAPQQPQNLLLAGTIHYRQGLLNQAEQNLRAYLSEVPGSRQATLLLAATLLKLGETSSAIDVLEPAAASAALDAGYLALLGSAYLRHGDAAKGLEYLERAAVLAPDVAAIRANLAVGYLTQGDLKQGASELQAAVASDEGLLQADVLLVMVYLQNRDYDGALTLAAALSEKWPDSPVPGNLRGAALLGKGDRQAARAALEAALEIKQDFMPAQLNMARLDLLDGDPDAAAARYKTVLSLDEGNLSALMALASLDARSGLPGEAELWLKRARALHPEAIEPAVMLTEHYLAQQEPTRALDTALAIWGIHPRDPGVLRVLSLAQLAAGDNEQAMTTLRTLVEVLPESAQAYYLMALMQLNHRDTDGARKNLQLALARQEDFPEAEIALGRIEIADKSYEAALKIADRLQQAHPDAAYGYELQGDVHAVRKEYKQAASAYGLAQERTATPKLAYKLFRSRLQAGDGKQARQDMRQWVEEHPDDQPVRDLLASTQLSMASVARSAGLRQRAVEEYLQILEYDPDNLTALNNLAWLYQRDGNPDAVKYAERAYALAPERPQVMTTLGWMLVQNGNVARGLPLLQDAADKAPRTLGIRYYLAYALDQAGRTDEARTELDNLLTSAEIFSEREMAEALRKRLGSVR